MDILSLNSLHATLLSAYPRIKLEGLSSPLFEQFFQVGLFDFLLLSYANEVQFDNQRTILKCFENCGNFEHFLDYISLEKDERFDEIEQYFTATKVSFPRLLDVLFQAMSIFKNSNNLYQLHLMHIAHNLNSKFLESNPFYWDYVSNYAVNAKVWLDLLNIVTDTLATKQEFDFYSIIAFFQKQMEFFPEHIRESILMNLGIHLKLAIFFPITGYANPTNFINWFKSEVQRKKEQKKSLTLSSAF